MNKSFKEAKEANDKINTLSKIKDKSIIIYIIKKFIKDSIDLTKNARTQVIEEKN